ncbi:NAD(P)H-flavin reductase [Colwellia sp. 4_MG-2023]|uniref:NAD(P)H-flavin reductase n=1 Tax=unclassified Colwellia TaxID=196834 RepID=UPI001C0A0C35|nr:MULTISPECIES: NAD(P)H-flavin reductase [unclassified Colwellia]MBU2924982.1 NAD(P)H-flavin reductase [Colwellia sp. C2M11]MDO6487754.1 NAD(P)H-flavin reductase [Colwellia sp. 6_MG-2023]MDO6506881.1 NAD(P)H-flavin reductase [Colwellia sp. 5_MG-2023]MDO6555744.1 NAD(P)H-flavin reductase [Colwellia sp. 4_MG-2023]MDO6652785.1 NAD(P)H-flavin reductase [Colwellia sp. 3_MG-2023]
MKTVDCQIVSLTSLTPHVFKVLLKPNEKVNFIAGQYLNFVMSHEDKRPFSIASSPNNELIELQIGAFIADSYPMQVIERLQAAQAANEPVSIEIPLGNAELRLDSERPLLLLAGGTGFSYIKSMFEYLAEEKSQRPVIVYWGLRELAAAYELDETAAIIAKLPQAQFIPVIENVGESEIWQGKTGLVHNAAMDDIANLEDYDIYLAGRFEMVGIIRDDFVKRGALLAHMHADAFAFI